MKTAPAPRNAPRRRGALLDLQCPECAGAVRIARDELVEGAPIECLHCGLQAELRNEYDAFARRKTWFLVDPRAELDDEERRA